jgi:hypothetical protein
VPAALIRLRCDALRSVCANAAAEDDRDPDPGIHAWGALLIVKTGIAKGATRFQSAIMPDSPRTAIRTGRRHDLREADLAFGASPPRPDVAGKPRTKYLPDI